MMLTSALVSLLAAASAAAAANTYHLRVFHPGSPVHHGRVTASQGSLAIEMPQDVVCKKGGPQHPEVATFVLNGSEAYLYSGPGSRNIQQVFTDRSGMGRGFVGYLKSPHPLGANWQTQGFDLDGDLNLTFQVTNGFYACPTGDSYVLRLQQQGKCVPVRVHAEPVEKPIACQYNGGQ